MVGMKIKRHRYIHLGIILGLCFIYGFSWLPALLGIFVAGLFLEKCSDWYFDWKHGPLPDDWPDD